MATPQQSPDTWLQIRRVFSAPREKIFRAWTEQKILEQWMCRDNPANTTRYLELDVRTGGHYKLETKNINGDIYLLRGIYREVLPPEKLVFTWAWKKTPVREGEVSESDETLITVEFFERGKSTEVILTHELFANAHLRDLHNTGWTGCFDILGKVLEASA